MIPYFGAMIGSILIILITLLTKNIYAAIGVALYIVIVQQVDGNIVQPRVVGGTVGIRPIYVLLGITLFGGLFGFWGIFSACRCGDHPDAGQRPDRPQAPAAGCRSAGRDSGRRETGRGATAGCCRVSKARKYLKSRPEILALAEI